MQAVMREVYVCETCRRVFLYRTEHDEESCARRLELELQTKHLYDERLAETRARVLDAARKDPALKLLAVHGCEGPALDRAEKLFYEATVPDLYPTLMTGEILGEMVAAAREGQ